MKFKLAVFRLTAQERFLLDLLQQAGDGAGHRIDGSADHPDLIHGRGRNPVMQVALRYRGDSLLHGGDVAVDLPEDVVHHQGCKEHDARASGDVDHGQPLQFARRISEVDDLAKPQIAVCDRFPTRRIRLRTQRDVLARIGVERQEGFHGCVKIMQHGRAVGIEYDGPGVGQPVRILIKDRRVHIDDHIPGVLHGGKGEQHAADIDRPVLLRRQSRRPRPSRQSRLSCSRLPR